LKIISDKNAEIDSLKQKIIIANVSEETTKTNHYINQYNITINA